MTTQRPATAANLLQPIMPEISKILSKTTAPEYRMTGRFRMEYMITMIVEKTSFVDLPKRSSISAGIVVVPIFR